MLIQGRGGPTVSFVLLQMIVTEEKRAFFSPNLQLACAHVCVCVCVYTQMCFCSDTLVILGDATSFCPAEGAVDQHKSGVFASGRLRVYPSSSSPLSSLSELRAPPAFSAGLHPSLRSSASASHLLHFSFSSGLGLGSNSHLSLCLMVALWSASQ